MVSEITAIRVGDWKAVFMEQRAKGMQVWREPFVELRSPKLFNLRQDPFERADHNSNTYWDWMIDKAPQLYVGLAQTALFLQTFAEFPPSQKADSWSVDKLTERFLQQAEKSQ